MRENPFDSDPPPDEAWWERELHRNEKLMDKYMAVMDENPDWVNWKNPEDLYNKVHFGIDPPPANEEMPPGEPNEVNEFDPTEKAKNCAPDTIGPGPPSTSIPASPEDDSDLSPEDAAMIQAMNAACQLPAGLDPFVDESFSREDYPKIAKQAREFAVRVMQVGNGVPAEMSVLLVSAGKVGANLAGGHGLGYANRSICGNIVKCRWALADCEFCREMLEYLFARNADPVFAELGRQAAQLGETIKERILQLRARVWW